jgi:hypothetical protein
LPCFIPTSRSGGKGHGQFLDHNCALQWLHDQITDGKMKKELGEQWKEHLMARLKVAPDAPALPMPTQSFKQFQHRYNVIVVPKFRRSEWPVPVDAPPKAAKKRKSLLPVKERLLPKPAAPSPAPLAVAAHEPEALPLAVSLYVPGKGKSFVLDPTDFVEPFRQLGADAARHHYVFPCVISPSRVTIFVGGQVDPAILKKCGHHRYELFRIKTNESKLPAIGMEEIEREAAKLPTEWWHQQAEDQHLGSKRRKGASRASDAMPSDEEAS